MSWTFTTLKSAIQDYTQSQAISDAIIAGVVDQVYESPEAGLEALEGASKSIDMSFLSEIKVLEEKVSKLENADTTHNHDFDHTHDDSAVKIVEKEIELLKIQIEEIKVKSSNPLAN